jgi:hypothetical protein
MTKNIAIENISLDDERVAFVEASPSGWAGYIKVEEFHQALKDARVPEKMWPAKPTIHKRLERAMKAQRHSTDILIRPLSQSKGWSLVVEDGKELELEGDEKHKTAHSVDLTCRVKLVNDLALIEAVPWDHPNVKSIREEFSRFEDVFKCSEDLSHWFSQKIVPWCRGVATRSRGGSYYIMKGDDLNRIRKVSTALAAVSETFEIPIKVGDTHVNLTKVGQGGRIILKPEVASTAAVEILMDNFITECGQVTDSISAKAKAGKIGKRALTTQQGLATDQLDKLEAFEELLDTKLDIYRDSLNEAKEEVGMAALFALSSED